MASRVRRLFEQFQPDNYQLHLIPDRETMTFSGTVAIRGKKVGRPSQRLTFHQKDLKIRSAQIIKYEKGKEKKIEVKRINLQNSLNEARLHTDEMLFGGDYLMTIDFDGQITRPMNGIYPCFYNHDGQEKTLIATQFESHHAREAFPCVDEPEAKATFDLAITAPTGETVLANTPVRSVLKEGENSVHLFETSPKMSTYLLAFVFGEMHKVSGKTKQGVEVSSWSTIAQPAAHLTYANQEAIDLLEFFIDYFQVPFPLKKLDQVALPDFESLAMENWGLITYREVGLLADPKNRSISGEQLISLVIAHELSHQWFGNLVTMKWWDDLWLNESFASIMENIAPDRLHPDWQQWEDFATGRVLSCSHRDIYKDVQPVSVAVNHPDEISTLFDPSIVYAKGARLINMLLDYIGEEAFRAGLKQYFEKHAYGNTTRDDLWAALGQASGKDVGALMTPWIEKAGTPLIKVKQSDGALQLDQHRFLLDGQDQASIWPIPLLADKKVEPEIFDNRSGSISYQGDAPILNYHGNAHAIVDYQDSQTRTRLSQAISSRSIDSLARINILNDSILLSRSGEYSLAEMLPLVLTCTDEPRDAVWSMFGRIIAQAQSLTDGDETTEERLKKYKARVAAHWYKKLGWEDKPTDDTNTKHLRSTALALSIAGEDKDAIDKALRLYAKAKNVQNLPAEQRAMIASVAVRFGKPSVVDELFNEYETSPNPEVQHSIASALCSTRDTKVAQRIIQWGLTQNGAVRPQDIDRWFAYLMRNFRTRELAWKWLTTSWDYLTETAGSKHLEYFIWYSSGPISTPKWQKRFREFFEPKLAEKGSKRNIEIAFGEIQARIDWRQREESALVKYFEQNFSD